MARSSSDGFDQWVFAIDRRRHVPHGKTDLLNDLSARSDGSALTTLLCLASAIFVTWCCRISITIMRRARTCPWIRIRPYRVLLRGQGVFFAVQSSADCITNMTGFDLRQAQQSEFMKSSMASMQKQSMDMMRAGKEAAE